MLLVSLPFVSYTSKRKLCPLLYSKKRFTNSGLEIKINEKAGTWVHR